MRAAKSLDGYVATENTPLKTGIGKEIKNTVVDPFTALTIAAVKTVKPVFIFQGNCLVHLIKHRDVFLFYTRVKMYV